MFPVFLGNDPSGKTIGTHGWPISTFGILATNVVGISVPASIEIEASKFARNTNPYFDEREAETEAPLQLLIKNDWHETTWPSKLQNRAGE